VPHRSLAGLVSAYKSYGNWEDNRTLEQHPAWHLRLRWEEFAIAVGVTGIIARRFTPNLSIILGVDLPLAACCC